MLLGETQELRLVSGTLHRLIPLRFHSRLMVYNTLIFLVVSYVIAFIAFRYVVKVDTMKELQQSRDALNTIFNYYNQKNNEFVNFVLPMYVTPNNYGAIHHLLEAKSDQIYDKDPYAKQHIVQVMRNITNRDADIVAILVRKNLTDAQFVYVKESNTFERVPSNYPFIEQLKNKKSGRAFFGTRMIDGGYSTPTPVYGIAGTFNTRNPVQFDAGQFMIAFQTESINEALQAYYEKTLGQFVIVSRNGEIIYDSSMRYGKSKFLHMDVLLSGKNSATINGKPYYIQEISTPNYIAANLVPKDELNQTSMVLPISIFGGVTAVAILCAVLYFIAGTLASRRIKELIRAMTLVGSSNLSYRIPVERRNDEFDELANRYNIMCDELSEMIQREYIGEIEKKNAELKALQSTISPHFLYNTLEAIRVKAIDDGNVDVSEMIMLLARLYRSVVRDDTFIPLQRELSLCNMYTNIFSLRYDTHLDYEINVAPELMKYGVPKNLLQPLIENYFVHGIRDHFEDNQLTIIGTIQDNDIQIIFEDNGRGLDCIRLNEVNALLNGNRETNMVQRGYGLMNVRARIQLVYGESYGLTIESEENKGTRVTVRLQAKMCDELETRFRQASNYRGSRR